MRVSNYKAGSLSSSTIESCNEEQEINELKFEMCAENNKLA